MIALKERYLAAVLRMIPVDARADIEPELRSAIDDAIEEMIKDGATGADAERAALTALGDPARLAADYSNRPLWLIGPAYYLAWLRTMGWLLRTLPALVGGISLVALLATGEEVLGALLSSLIVAVLAAVNVVVWSTVGFIIAERSRDTTQSDGDPPLTRWRIEQLPATASDRQFSLPATVGRVVVDIVVVVALFSVQSLSDVPIVAAQAWDIAIPALIGLLIASSAFAVVRYRRGAWTTPLAVANTILNAAFAIWWTWVLWDLALLDPAFVARVDPSPALTITARIIAVIIIAACVWDAIEGIAGARRAGSAHRPALPSTDRDRSDEALPPINGAGWEQ